MNTKTLRASQTAISFDDEGNGPVLILLHASARFPDVERQRAGLSDGRVLAPDFPGFGRSAPRLTIDLGRHGGGVAGPSGCKRTCLRGWPFDGRLCGTGIRQVVPPTTASADSGRHQGRSARRSRAGGPEREDRSRHDSGPGCSGRSTTPKNAGCGHAYKSARSGAPGSRDRDEPVRGGDRRCTQGSARSAGCDLPAHTFYPTLVLVGEEDSITPPESQGDGQRNSRCATVALKAADTVNLEDPDIHHNHSALLDELPVRPGVMD